MKHLRTRGFSFIEAVVSVGIAAVVLVGMLSAFQFYLRAALHIPERVQATFLAEEGLEALRSIRGDDWATFAALSGSTRYLSFSGGAWSVTATPEYLDGMLRSFVISDVSRDAQDDIVLSSGTNDPATKKAAVTIAWREGAATTTLVLATYFADIYEE